MVKSHSLLSKFDITVVLAKEKDSIKIPKSRPSVN